MKTQVRKHRFTVEDYHRMTEVGILGEDDRVELIDGEIVRTSPVKSPHAAHVNRLNSLFAPRAREAFVIAIQNPVQLDDYSEPRPDVAVLRYRSDSYVERHPLPSDVLLVIEVSDSSLEHDREVKVPLYARSGIPEVWLVNLPERVIEVYRRATDQSYQSVERIGPGGTLSPLELSGVTLAASDVLIGAGS